jgi:hypothetical protein
VESFDGKVYSISSLFVLFIKKLLPEFRIQAMGRDLDADGDFGTEVHSGQQLLPVQVHPTQRRQRAVHNYR